MGAVMLNSSPCGETQNKNEAERPLKQSLFEIELFRCHTCRKLWTPDMIRNGGNCRCGDYHVVRAKSISFFEEINLLFKMATGKIKLRSL